MVKKVEFYKSLYLESTAVGIEDYESLRKTYTRKYKYHLTDLFHKNYGEIELWFDGYFGMDTDIESGFNSSYVEIDNIVLFITDVETQEMKLPEFYNRKNTKLENYISDELVNYFR